MAFIKNTSKDQPVNEHLMLIDYRRTGNLEVLGKLYQGYMPLVYGLCLKYFKDTDKAKDAVMQIFEQLIEKLKIHEVTNFKGWLYTLARNYCLMELRASGKHEFITLEENVVENATDLHLDIDELQEKQLNSLEQCIETLPDDQRKSIQLFYLEQKCYKDISEITGFDLNKVKSYIQNGKRNLKICIEKRIGN